jgi:plastocyanin
VKGRHVTAVAPPTPTIDAPARDGHVWLTLLAWTAGGVAAVDLLFMLAVGAVIPPLVGGIVATGVGLALLHRRRAAIIVLALTSLLMLTGAVQFGLEHLAHPSSGADFGHAVVGILGRIVALVAAVGAWRRLASVWARRLAAGTVGLAALTILVATVATIAATGDQPRAGDVVTVVDRHAFEPTVEVEAGGTLFIDNRELFRHTFTVEGSTLDVEVPAGQGVRAAVDLPSGSHAVVCAVPGHEAMTATLEVR